jgi:hypothetical protein
MLILLKDLIKDPSRLGELQLQRRGCACCNTDLQETVTGRRRSPKGDVCSDCYFEQLGEVVEESPISTARVRRG